MSSGARAAAQLSRTSESLAAFTTVAVLTLP